MLALCGGDMDKCLTEFKMNIQDLSGKKPPLTLCQEVEGQLPPPTPPIDDDDGVEFAPPSPTPRSLEDIMTIIDDSLEDLSEDDLMTLNHHIYTTIKKRRFEVIRQKRNRYGVNNIVRIYDEKSDKEYGYGRIIKVNIKRCIVDIYGGGSANVPLEFIHDDDRSLHLVK